MKPKHKNKMVEPKEDKGMQNWFRSKLFTMKMEKEAKKKAEKEKQNEKK